MASRLLIDDIRNNIYNKFNDSIFLISTDIKNSKEKVIFSCKEHGEFYHTYSKLIRTKKPCPKCNSKLNNDIIPLLMEKHNNLYDYTLCIDKIHRNISIMCKKHGEFKQDIYSHLNGNGCPQCSGIIKYNDDFIKKCKLVHGNKYNYDRTLYIGSHKKIKIICKRHGEFEQKANNHLNGQNCKLCSTDVYTKEECINILDIKHNGKYSYKNIEFDNRESIISVNCNIHGEFNIKLGLHLSGTGCKKCSDDKKRSNNIDFIKRCNFKHNYRYDYTNLNYISSKNKINIICKKHGEFIQVASSHLNGSGCPKCRTSNGEILIIDYLDNHGIDYEYQYKFDDCRNILPLPFDFYLSKFNICIEFDGSQHYQINDFFGGISSFEKLKINDNIKNNYCIYNNIKLYRIPYWDIYKLNNILDSIFN